MNGAVHSARTLGIIGGMSWESTLLCYQGINRRFNQLLGGVHSAPLLLHSVDFAEIDKHQRRERWDLAGELLAASARRLEAAGAEGLILCTNTMHKVSPTLIAATNLPFLDLIDITGDAAVRAGYRRVGLLATRYTLEDGFYHDRIQSGRRLEVLTPDAAETETLHRIIFDELCRGRVESASKKFARTLGARLGDRGCEALILGCTELALLIAPEDSPLPLLDSTELQVEAAVDWMLQQDKP